MKAARLYALGIVGALVYVWAMVTVAGCANEQGERGMNFTAITAPIVTVRAESRTKDSIGPRCPIPSPKILRTSRK